MRILVVVHQFLPRNVAGTEVYTYRMARELGRRHEVRLLFGELEPGRPQHEVDEGVYEGIPFTRMVCNYRFARFEETWRNPAAEEVFLRELDRFRPDLIHIQHLQAFSVGLPLLARLRGIPVVYTLHEYAILCPAGGQLLLPGLERCPGPEPERCGSCIRERALVPADEAGVAPERVAAWEAERRAAAHREMARHVSRFLAPSRYLRDAFVRAGFPAERFEVLDNGFDVAPFRGFRRTPSGRLRFGFVGAMVPHKGVHLLVEAFHGLGGGDWELHLFGGVRPDSPHAPYAEGIRETIRDPRIRMRGPFRVDRVAEAYAEIDVLVIPSLWVENSPLTIHEAFVCGAPVIAAGIGGMAELVRDGVSGLHFEAGSAASLRAAARRLLVEPGLLERLRAGIPPVKTMEEHGRELDRLYAGLRAEPLGAGERQGVEAYVASLPARARAAREGSRGLGEVDGGEPARLSRRPWWRRLF